MDECLTSGFIRTDPLTSLIGSFQANSCNLHLTGSELNENLIQ